MSEKIPFCCAECGHKMMIPITLIGKRGECPKCGNVTRVAATPPSALSEGVAAKPTPVTGPPPIVSGTESKLAHVKAAILKSPKVPAGILFSVGCWIGASLYAGLWDEYSLWVYWLVFLGALGTCNCAVQIWRSKPGEDEADTWFSLVTGSVLSVVLLAFFVFVFSATPEDRNDGIADASSSRNKAHDSSSTEPKPDEGKSQPATPKKQIDDDPTPPDPLTEDQRQAITQLYKGRRFRAEEDYATAISFFTEAIRLDPTHIDSHTDRAMAYLMVGANDKAIEDFTKAIRLDPKLVSTRTGLGFVYNCSRKYDKAIEAYSDAIRLDPNSGGAYYNRGINHEELKNLESAVRDYNKAIEIKDPHYTAIASLRLGGLYHDEFKAKTGTDKGIVACSKGIDLIKEGKIPAPRKEDHAHLYHLRGRFYSRKEEHEKAIADFTVAIKIRPDYSNAFAYRGGTYLDQKKYDEALADLIKASELDPDNYIAYLILANYYDELGDKKKAAAYRAMQDEALLRSDE